MLCTNCESLKTHYPTWEATLHDPSWRCFLCWELWRSEAKGHVKKPAQMSTNGACRRGVLLSRHFMATTLNIPGLLKSQAGTNPQSCASACSCSDTRNLSLPSPLPQLTQKQEQHLYYPLTFANGWCIAEHIPSSAFRPKAAIRCLAVVLREGLKCRGLRGLRHRNAYLVWSKWI